jgi:hypothetical protein
MLLRHNDMPFALPTLADRACGIATAPRRELTTIGRIPLVRRFRLPSPSLVDILFLCLALAVPLGRAEVLLNSDGDLGRHLRVGEYILANGWLRTDVFSFTKFGQPFVGYEWLSEVLFALVYRIGGLPLVAVACGLLIAGTYALVVALLLRRGVDPLLAYLTGFVAAILGSLHWLARPHLFTLLGVLIVMGLLEPREPGGRRPLWFFVALFALWANLHGGFLFGLVLIALYLLGSLAEALVADTERERWLRTARYYGMALGLAAVGTLINPYGPRLLWHIIAWFRNSYVIDHTHEYLSPNFHLLSGKLTLGVLLLLFTALALSRRRPPFPRLLVILATIAAALIYQRNIPLLALTALPVLALHLDPEWRALPDWRGIRGTFQRESPGRKTGAWSVAVTVVLLLLSVSASPFARMQVIPGDWHPGIFPVEATAKARRAGLTGRIYNEFFWGGYLLKEWPEQRVFIDGQTDFYGDDLMRQHARIHVLDPGWRELLRRWEIDLVLMPSRERLPHELARDPSWRIWHCDSTAVILRRDSAPAPRADADSAEAELFRCAPPVRNEAEEPGD